MVVFKGLHFFTDKLIPEVFFVIRLKRLIRKFMIKIDPSKDPK